MMRGGPLLLGACAAALAGILVLEYHAARLEDEKLPLFSRVLPAAAAAGTWPAPPVDDLPARVADLLSRPLFAATRRPPPGPAGAAAAAGPALPRLTAVMVRSGDRRVMFAGQVGSKAVVLGVGGQIGAWRVQSIEDGQVIVSGPDGTHVLRPTYAAGSNAATPAVPSAPSGQSIIDLLRRGPRPSVDVPGLPATTAAP